MTTVAIQPILDASGQKFFRAVAGDKQSTGKTAALALYHFYIKMHIIILSPPNSRGVGGFNYTLLHVKSVLDALTTQLGEMEFRGILMLQSFRPDQFFGIEQQKRLSKLMELRREARDEEKSFPADLQAELKSLVEAELNATAERAKFLMQQQSQ